MIWPGLEQNAVVQRVASDRKQKEVLSSAKAIYLRGVEQADQFGRFHPKSDVLTSKAQGTELYFEYGFLGDADVLRLTKASAKALKMKTSSVQVEDGRTCSGYVISLEGLTVSEYNSIRKLKTSFKMEAVHLQTHMDRREQLTMEQGQNWFTHLCNMQMTHRPTGVQDAARHTLQTVATLRADPASGWKVVQETPPPPPPFAEDAEPPEVEATEAAEDTEDSTLGALQDAPAVEHRAGRAAASGADLDFGPSGKERPKKQKRKRDPAEDEDEDLLAEFGGEGNISAEDDEMLEVARRHCQVTGKQVSCFGDLVVARHLAGEKLWGGGEPIHPQGNAPC
ncbi:unnamed protein product [Symbiodinium sp. CCMP2592]|nr:unnamed protein product [Symbiodinium sp. CCMP2592]